MTGQSSAPVRVITTALVVVHLAATLWHGDAHASLAVSLPALKNLYVYIVILIAPIVAAIGIWTRYSGISLWIFTISMLGALLFGVYHHYVLVSPDNIQHLPAGSAQAQFIASAAVIALLELASALYGAFSLGAQRATGSEQLG